MDVSRYLSRIGLDGPGRVDLESLERLQRAHLTAVPFENLHVFHRLGVRTDTAWSVPKIVDRGRGGWCFELNGAFGALLEALGYAITRYAAVVLLEGDDGHASHLVLKVDLDRPYLVDVGFGDAFIRPLPLDDPGPHDGGTGLYSFRTTGDETTLMEMSSGDASQPVYRFTHTPCDLPSFDYQSTRLQTDLSLKWTKSRIATRLLDGGPDRVTLLHDKLRLRRDGVWEDHPVAPHAWEETLSEWFDLTIPGAADGATRSG
ncbi:MAG: arylamine N-acetyltransferase [Acidimicrobiia bacterium]|nr:arylamine N-acetyltransferase [Acidimicrobiia bacterium]